MGGREENWRVKEVTCSLLQYLWRWSSGNGKGWKETELVAKMVYTLLGMEARSHACKARTKSALLPVLKIIQNCWKLFTSTDRFSLVFLFLMFSFFKILFYLRFVGWLVGCFFRRVLLRSSGCQGAYYVDQADRGLRRPVCLCFPNSGVKSKFWIINLWHHTQPWLAFLDLCIFYTLILYWMNSWQRFPPIL